MSDRSDSPPLALSAATLDLLKEFYKEQEQREADFKKLEEDAESRFQSNKAITVDSFRHAFEEDWQLSQFWYSEAFSLKLAKYVRDLLGDNVATKRVAYLCCPTAYAGLRQYEDENHIKQKANANILEVDKRFRVLAGDDYIYYDLDEPKEVPESLLNTIDLAIIDPPFLNEITERKVHETLNLICKKNAQLLVLTSTSVREALENIYNDSRLGPLSQLDIPVEHGRGLQNEFAIWGNPLIDRNVTWSS